jgi:type IV secretion system protein VirB4
MPLVEQRRHAIGLADLLLYDSLIEEGVLLLQDGGLLAVWKFQGPDLGSATNGEMAALSGAWGPAPAWRELDGDVTAPAPRSRLSWCIQSSGFDYKDHRDERREQFMSEGVHFESDYYLALTYLPPIAREEKIKGWMFEGMKDKRGNAGRIVD